MHSVHIGQGIKCIICREEHEPFPTITNLNQAIKMLPKLPVIKVSDFLPPGSAYKIVENGEITLIVVSRDLEEVIHG